MRPKNRQAAYCGSDVGFLSWVVVKRIAVKSALIINTIR
jgi:hypothetical protein